MSPKAGEVQFQELSRSLEGLRMSKAVGLMRLMEGSTRVEVVMEGSTMAEVMTEGSTRAEVVVVGSTSEE